MALKAPSPCSMLRQQGARSWHVLSAPILNIRRCGANRPVVSCSAAAALTVSEASSAGGGALAIYSWPLKPSLQQPLTRSPTKLWSVQMWFEAMVQTVVKQLDGGAFLLRVGLNPVLSLQLIRLDAADLAAGWEHIQQQHMSSALQQDDAVILVHPVASEEQPCVVRQTAGSPCPGCPNTAVGGDVAAGFSTADGTELLHGKFGDCCHGGGEHSHGEHSHHHGHTHSSSGSRPMHQEDTVSAFYGLVVQTRNAADPLQGCYLLKTVKQSSSSSSECDCTHYSLNQVCKGPSLQQQYQASWLV